MQINVDKLLVYAYNLILNYVVTRHYQALLGMTKRETRYAH